MIWNRLITSSHKHCRIKANILTINNFSSLKLIDSKAVVRDILGKIIDKIDFNTETTVYNTDNLKSGVYFINIKTEKGKVSHKFIKK